MLKALHTSLILVSITLLGAGCARYQAPVSPTAYPQEESAVPTPAPVVPEALIEYREGAFDPSTLRVLAGTKVTFVNKGSKEVWPASGRHPTHEICPGFDALKSLKNGETYSYRFDKPAECPFHNHVAPGEKGSIEVKTGE